MSKKLDKIRLILILKDGKKVFIRLEEWREIQLNKLKI